MRGNVCNVFCIKPIKVERVCRNEFNLVMAQTIYSNSAVSPVISRLIFTDSCGYPTAFVNSKRSASLSTQADVLRITV